MNHVMHYLEKSASLYPNKIAVIDQESSCTYQELRDKSLAVANGLLCAGYQKEPIAVMMEKKIATLEAFFGISYVQGSYTVYQPDLPEARLQQLQSLLQARCIITDRIHAHQARSLFPAVQVLLIEDLIQKPAKPLDLNSAIDTRPLYIHFTSGSTGTPKGVVVSHQTVIQFIDVFTETFDICKSDRIANQAPFDFDVSVKDIYSCLSTGATLVIVPKTCFSNPTKLMDYLCEHEVTTLIWAVSALTLVCIFHGLDYKVPHTIRQIMFSGEVMPMKHLKTWHDHLPHARLVNLYGPTEITCNCTYHIVDMQKDEKGLPIGRPFRNEMVFLIDESGRLVDGLRQTGEIVVGGSTLALGYYKQNELTQKRFIQNPLHNDYVDRVYLTGDLAYYNEDGELMYVGRKDFQIKYQGHRIELEEIEYAMMQIPSVQACCCLFDPVRKKLHAFYQGALSGEALRSELSKKLPVYMLPSRLEALDHLPLQPNGKIDRRLLRRRAGIHDME